MYICTSIAYRKCNARDVCDLGKMGKTFTEFTIHIDAVVKYIHYACAIQTLCYCVTVDVCRWGMRGPGENREKNDDDDDDNEKMERQRSKNKKVKNRNTTKRCLSWLVEMRFL